MEMISSTSSKIKAADTKTANYKGHLYFKQKKNFFSTCKLKKTDVARKEGSSISLSLERNFFFLKNSKFESSKNFAFGISGVRDEGQGAFLK